MKKLMLMASMLAMVLLAASPAMAQTSNTSNQFCQNVLGDIVVVNENVANVDTGNEGDATGGDAVGVQNAELVQLQNQEAALINDIKAIQANIAAIDAGEAQYGDLDVQQQNLIEAENELDQVQAQIAEIKQFQVVEGGDAVISDDDVVDIAQENNTTINVVQNCIQTAVQTGDIAIDNDKVIVHKDKDYDKHYNNDKDYDKKDYDKHYNNDKDYDKKDYDKHYNNDKDYDKKDYDKDIVKPVVIEKVVEKGYKVEVVEAAAYAYAKAEAKGYAYADCKAEAYAAAKAHDAGAPEAVAKAVAEAAAYATADGSAVAHAEADAPAAQYEKADDAEADAVTVLPDTGGASLFTLAAGALLVAGGLLARRIVR